MLEDCSTLPAFSFLGDPDGVAARRLAELPARGAELADLYDQALALMTGLAGAGFAHGDLSAYNLLVYSGRPVLIDLPQVVDVVANPQSRMLLDRDATTVAGWFTAHGFGVDTPALLDLLHAEARLG